MATNLLPPDWYMVSNISKAAATSTDGYMATNISKEPATSTYGYQHATRTCYLHIWVQGYQQFKGTCYLYHPWKYLFVVYIMAISSSNYTASNY
jgi:hypothetical protein